MSDSVKSRHHDATSSLYSADATDRELQIAVENSMTGIAWLNSEGIFQRVRSGYAGMLGYAAEEMTGLSWSVTVPEDDHEKAIAAVIQMLEHGRAEVEIRALRQDGSTFHKKLLLVKTFDDQGEHNGHYCFMRDITKRKEAEEALQRSREFANRLIGVIQDGVSVVDAQGRHIQVNEAFLEMTGFSEEELVGAGPPHPYWPPEHLDNILSAFENRPFGASYHELIFQRKNGQRFPVLVTPSTTVDDRGNATHIATVKDISDRKESERRLVDEERLKTMGTLAGGIAHDLNNLLTPVLGYADALLNGLLDVEDAAGAIRDASQRAQELIERILQFSRKDGHAEGPVRVTEAATDALQFARTSLPTRVSVETHFEAARDSVMCAEAVMQQVVMNLVSNAGYAMRETGGKLTVRISNPSQSEVAIEVSDTGPGIPESMRERIFEPFFTTKPAGEGTGLGLATIRSVVNEIGGSISVHSFEGEGTCLEIRLPLSQAPRTEEDCDIAQGTEISPGLRVLLLDDQSSVLAVCSAMLEHLGHTASCFETVGEALDADLGSFDLVITDYRMDGVTGIDFVEQANELSAPVILMTGDRDAVDALPPAFADRLSKPFTLDALKNSIAVATRG